MNFSFRVTWTTLYRIFSAFLLNRLHRPSESIMPSIGYDVVVAILFNYLNRFQKLNLVFI
jgi:hypothetical protein